MLDKRIEREYNIPLIATAPSVCLHGLLGKYVMPPSCTKRLPNGEFKAIKKEGKEPMIFFVNKKSEVSILAFI